MLHQLYEYVTTASNRYSSISFYGQKMPVKTQLYRTYMCVYIHIYMPTSKIFSIKQEEIVEGGYYILSNLPFAHHLHGNSHLEESVKPLVFLHYHSCKKVVSQFL